MNARAFLLLVWLLSPLSWGSVSPESFFVEPQLMTVSMNPNGEMLAKVERHNDELAINLVSSSNLDDLLTISQEKLSQNEIHIERLSWIDDRTLAVELSEKRKGVKYLRDTQKVSNLVIAEIAADKRSFTLKSVRTKGWLVDPLSKEPGQFLYAKSGFRSKLYKIEVSKLLGYKHKRSRLEKIDGGQFIKSNEVASVENFAIRWFVGLDEEPVAALTKNRRGDLFLNELGQDSDKKEIKKWSREALDNDNNNEKLLIPVELASSKGSYYCLDFSEEEHRSVYLVDFSGDTEELVYQADSFEILNLILAEESNELIGAKLLNNGDIVDFYLGARGQADQQSSASGEVRQLLAAADGGRFELSYYDHFNHPGSYFLTDNNSGAQRLVGSEYPLLLERLKGQQVQGVVDSEGLEIPYILNLPVVSNGQAPLIVMPHGGPIGVFDSPYFDLSTQYLVANGFAVLRVNYRGSSGFTEQHELAGKKQWGNMILEDIYQATRHVAAMKEVDQQQICIAGMSYGGYAATALTIKYPDTYKCGVSVAGVSDVNLQLNTPYKSERQARWMKEFIGDTVADYDAMKDISPLYHAMDAKRPLLLIHGEQDKVVDVEHSSRLKLVLDKYEKQNQLILLPDAGHNLGGHENVGKTFGEIVSFVRRSLGRDKLAEAH